MKRRNTLDCIRLVIKKHKNQLEKEIQEWKKKMRDTESYWGFGGPYKRQEKALELREKELEELEELERQLGRYTPYKDITVYVVYCRNCGNIVMSRQQPINEWHECPHCKKMIYDNNPYCKTLRIEDDGELWLKAFAETNREYNEEG